MGDFLSGLRMYGQAWSILFSRKFRWFLLLPLAVWALLFGLGNGLVNYAAGEAYAWLEEWLSGFSWLNGMSTAVGWMIRIAFRIFYFLLFAAFGGYVVLMAMSPVYSWLSERTEAHLTGKKRSFRLREFGWEIFRGIRIVWRNMVVQGLVVFLLFLLSFIPLVQWVTPILVFFVSAYFYGFSFMDYAVELKRFSVRQSVRYMNRRIGTVTGIGSVFALSLLLPWFGLLICCYVSLLSVIAGTIAVNREALPDRSVG